MNVHIGLLADHPEILAPLAAAYEREWPEWYGVHGDALTDLTERSRRAGLPISLVAFADDTLVGTLALGAKSVASHSHISPWIIGFWVEPSRRNRGIGSGLLTAACNHASGEGISRLYAATATSSGLFARENWVAVDTAMTDIGETITIFSKKLGP